MSKEKMKDSNYESEADIPSFGTSEPTEYEKKHCFVRTFGYRNINVDIFVDDYGQCYYFYLLGEQYSCGSFDPFPEDYIKYEIDKRLDTLCFLGNINKKYWGAEVKYDDIEHTSRSLYYRGLKVKSIPPSLTASQAISYGVNEMNRILSRKKKVGK